MTVNSIKLSDETVQARKQMRRERLEKTAAERTQQIRAERSAQRKRGALKSLFTPREA